ncbi:hypothetical protein Tco_1555854 [Tanacetum coccineum]
MRIGVGGVGLNWGENARGSLSGKVIGRVLLGWLLSGGGSWWMDEAGVWVGLVILRLDGLGGVLGAYWWGGVEGLVWGAWEVWAICRCWVVVGKLIMRKFCGAIGERGYSGRGSSCLVTQ